MDAVVSIIIPVYNVEKYLDKCMETVVGQTYEALEILLVDDGSPDRCPELCDRWAQRDTRVRVIHHANGGLGQARNAGMDDASGAYILFADPDDFLPLDAVQTLLERMISDGSDMAVGKIREVFADGHTDGRRWDFIQDRCVTGEELLCGMDGLEQSLVNILGRLYTRKALEGIRFPAMNCGEDVWVFPLVCLQCRTVSLVNHVVYNYFQRGDSITHTKTDEQRVEALHSSLHMAQIYLEKGYPDCAARWFGITIQFIQELQDRRPGIALAESVFPEQEIRGLLKSGNAVARGKWYLLRHPRLYDAVFGMKRAVTGLLKKAVWRKSEDA